MLFLQKHISLSSAPCLGFSWEILETQASCDVMLSVIIGKSISPLACCIYCPYMEGTHHACIVHFFFSSYNGQNCYLHNVWLVLKAGSPLSLNIPSNSCSCKEFLLFSLFYFIHIRIWRIFYTYDNHVGSCEKQDNLSIHSQSRVHGILCRVRWAYLCIPLRPKIAVLCHLFMQYLIFFPEPFFYMDT